MLELGLFAEPRVRGELAMLGNPGSERRGRHAVAAFVFSFAEASASV